MTFKVAYVCVKVYNEFGQSTNVDLCHLTICIYDPDILAVYPRQSGQIGLINREES